MKRLYESDKYDILNNIEYVSKTIIERLYRTFDEIDEEADVVEKMAYEKSGKLFNPETMDESFGLEEAYHEGVNHYIIQTKMKNEFLNSSIIWLFHLFEKDCIEIFTTNNGNEKKRILQDIGIDIDKDSLWAKCNNELRLIANTIKHGNGDSSEKLKLIKPEIFKNNFMNLSGAEIQLSINEVKYYIETMNSFWVLFFSVTLPEYK